MQANFKTSLQLEHKSKTNYNKFVLNTLNIYVPTALQISEEVFDFLGDIVLTLPIFFR